jgi:hypothetical protein
VIFGKRVFAASNDCTRYFYKIEFNDFNPFARVGARHPASQTKPRRKNVIGRLAANAASRNHGRA